MSEEELKKKKNISKLYVVTAIRKYTENGSMLDLIVEDSNDVLMENYRSYSTAESKYKEVIKECYDDMKSYLKENNSNYIGKEMVDFYYEHIDSCLNQVIDYINVHRLHMNTADIMELRDNCKDELFKKVREEIESVKSILSEDYSMYLSGNVVEKDTDFIDSLFGGIKEITVYQPSFDAAWEAAEKMTKDLQQVESLVDMNMHRFVCSKFLMRIDDIVRQINIACGNNEAQ